MSACWPTTGRGRLRGEQGTLSTRAAGPLVRGREPLPLLPCRERLLAPAAAPPTRRPGGGAPRATAAAPGRGRPRLSRVLGGWSGPRPAPARRSTSGEPEGVVSNPGSDGVFRPGRASSQPDSHAADRATRGSSQKRNLFYETQTPGLKSKATSNHARDGEACLTRRGFQPSLAVHDRDARCFKFILYLAEQAVLAQSPGRGGADAVELGLGDGVCPGRQVLRVGTNAGASSGESRWRSERVRRGRRGAENCCSAMMGGG